MAILCAFGFCFTYGKDLPFGISHEFQSEIYIFGVTYMSVFVRVV